MCAISLDTQSLMVNLCHEQYQLWAGLGFVASIATGPVICQSLSSAHWVELLLKVIASEHTPNGVTHLPRRVSFRKSYSLSELYFID